MAWTAEECLLGFARAVRAAGLSVTPDREFTFLRSIALVGMSDRKSLYWAGRATLTCSPADGDPYDQVFEQWFSGTAMDTINRAQRPAATVVQASLDGAEGGHAGGSESEEMIRALASEPGSAVSLGVMAGL